jgi:hypothetical protein
MRRLYKMTKYAKTGVCSINKIQWLIEDMFNNGINTTQEEREKEFYAGLCEKYGLPEDYDFNDSVFIREKEPDFDYNLEMLNEGNDYDTILIGYIKGSDGLYDIDPNAEYSAVCNELWAHITASEYVCRCGAGSPCIPYQGDLESPGNELCFTLPADVWGDDKPEFMEIIETKEKYENKTALCLKFGSCMDTNLDD